MLNELHSLLTYPPPWAIALTSALTGAVVVGLVAYFVNVALENRQRKKDKTDVKHAIYQEIADHVGRCLNDYIESWKQFDVENPPEPKKNVRWLKTFRPPEPTIYSSLTAKLGLIESKPLGLVVHFYLQLDTVRQDIDRWPSSELGELGKDDIKSIARRFRETLVSGLEALEVLGAGLPYREEIDRDVAARYRAIASQRLGLLDGLRMIVGKHSPDEPRFRAKP